MTLCIESKQDLRNLFAGVRPRKYKDSEEGRERYCCKCEEYWPATLEFFWPLKRGDGLHSWCIACCRERTKELKAGAPRMKKRKRQ